MSIIDPYAFAPPSSLLTGLIASWKLDEASGTRNDSHGANHLTDNNTVTQAVGVGGAGTAAQFTRANAEYLSRADNADLSTGDISFSFTVWVYMDQVGGNFMDICNKNQGAEYRLFYNASNRFVWVVNSTTLAADLFGTPVVFTWYFIACIYNAATDEMKISVNDGAVNTRGSVTGPADSAAAFQLGKDNGTFAHWDGRMSHGNFFKKTLSASEITVLYNGGTPLEYPFSGGAAQGPVITFLGDSKTAAHQFQPTLLVSLNSSENPDTLASGGYTVANLNAAADAWIAGASGTIPEFILVNVGINDASAGTSQATFESELGSLLDKLNAEWASAQILVMRVWGRTFDAQCDLIDDTYIPNVLSSRGAFAAVGPDERIFLEHGDDGVTMTSDGIHPNATGYAETAAEWQTSMGL